MADEKYVTIRVPKRVLLSIYILLCVFIAVFAYNNWPRYIVLNPPVPENGFVISEGKTIYNPYEVDGVKMEGHNTWTWRRSYGFLPVEGDAYTLDSVLAYFDTWLNDHEWKKYEGRGEPCSIVTKTEFLGDITNLSAYVAENTSGSYYSSVVCLASWPYVTENNKTGFTVLLFTATK